MSTSQHPSKNTEKNLNKSDDLKTDIPMSEKDEVKAAEAKMAKKIKKESLDKGKK